jgi:peptidyl-prolyl cis-trans isomerase B (cyclophilin B)
MPIMRELRKGGMKPRRKRLRRHNNLMAKHSHLLFGAALLLAVAGCAGPETETTTTTQTTTTTRSAPPEASPAVHTPQTEEPVQDSGLPATAAPGATAPKEGDEVAVMETNHGRIVLKFFPDKAPKHVENFKTLAKKGFYDGVRFHRVIPGFMIQGGDPNSRDKPRNTHGQGGPGHTVPGEMNDIPHTRGILSAARTPDPNSAGSQFFITVAEASFLNPTFDSQGRLVPGREGYTVYGQVIEGMDVADKIVALKRDQNDNPLEENPAIIKSVKIEKWPLKN